MKLIDILCLLTVALVVFILTDFSWRCAIIKHGAAHYESTKYGSVKFVWNDSTNTVGCIIPTIILTYTAATNVTCIENVKE